MYRNYQNRGNTPLSGFDPITRGYSIGGLVYSREELEQQPPSVSLLDKLMGKK